MVRQHIVYADDYEGIDPSSEPGSVVIQTIHQEPDGQLIYTGPASLEDLLARNKAVRGRATKQKPKRSKQDFGTPPEFLSAIQNHFGPIAIDLAARADNAVAPYFVTPEADTFSVDWKTLIPTASRGYVAYINPEFGDLRKPAAKCETVRDLNRWTLMLCPASMGSKWWVDHVLGKCMAFGIPRLKFVGADTLYPKDLALLAYGFGVSGSGYWDWRKET
jgi:hypothetical protein